MKACARADAPCGRLPALCGLQKDDHAAHRRPRALPYRQLAGAQGCGRRTMAPGRPPSASGGRLVGAAPALPTRAAAAPAATAPTALPPGGDGLCQGRVDEHRHRPRWGRQRAQASGRTGGRVAGKRARAWCRSVTPRQQRMRAGPVRTLAGLNPVILRQTTRVRAVACFPVRPAGHSVPMYVIGTLLGEGAVVGSLGAGGPRDSGGLRQRTAGSLVLVAPRAWLTGGARAGKLALPQLIPVPAPCSQAGAA